MICDKMERLMAGDPVRPYFLLFLSVFALFIGAPADNACATGNPPAEVAPLPAGPGSEEHPIGTGPGTACDSGYWKALSWRAWMEGKLDQEAAQTIMNKQPSVLDVTCFTGQLDRLGLMADDIFSDNLTSRDLWAEKDFMPPRRFELFYQPLILPAPNNHFYIDIAGGSVSIGYKALSRANMEKALQRAIRDGLGYYLGNDFWPSSFCQSMFAVWDAAQANCSPFDAEHFFTFKDLVNMEPRKAIWGCRSTMEGNYSRLGWDIAVNGEPWLPWKEPGAFPPPLPTDPPDDPVVRKGGMDALSTYLPLTSSNSPYNDKGCGVAEPVPTGLLLKNGQEDAVCIIPGCWYDPAAKECKD
jgi:hypothetical protein